MTLLFRRNCVNLLWCLQEVIIENGTLFIYRTRKLMLCLHSKAVKLLVANHLTCHLTLPFCRLQEHLGVGELSRLHNELCVLDGTDTEI